MLLPGTYTMTRFTAVRAVPCLVLCLAAGAPVAGQEPEKPTPAPTPSPRPARRVAAPTLAAGIGGPLTAAASAGLILGIDRSAPDECPSPRGWLLQAEAGIGGVKLGGGPVFTYCHTVFGSLGAGSLQAAYVRTWGTPLGTEAGLNYVGGELDVGLIDWRVTLGLLKRTGSGTEGANLLFTWGLARGF
jgi:hypothetical protein